MSETVISVENLSKSYLVGHEGPKEKYHSLRDTLVRHGKNFARKSLDMARGRQIIQGDEVEEFWALKDVSFEVKQGEVLGIIGRNGAGKSTLLKVLSRITEPTAGRVVLNGRVASLLEVGTGFHPELSGRENIFLNGAILGMTRGEIRRKFDEIVEFAGVTKFLDTPVKRYSSGMYVRLAFAVAAHLDPEILIVDEVLAVGDAEFQKKCLGKMQDVARGGRTVLFVSHQLGAVRELCTSCMLLKSGKMQQRGHVSDVLESYASLSASSAIQKANTDKPVIADVKVDARKLANSDLEVEISIQSPTIIRQPKIGVVICDVEGTPVFGFNTDMDPEFSPPDTSVGNFVVNFGKLPLHPGTYWISAYLGNADQSLDVAKQITTFDYPSNVTLPAGISTRTVGCMAVSGKFHFNT